MHQHIPGGHVLARSMVVTAPAKCRSAFGGWRDIGPHERWKTDENGASRHPFNGTFYFVVPKSGDDEAD